MYCLIGCTRSSRTSDHRGRVRSYWCQCGDILRGIAPGESELGWILYIWISVLSILHIYCMYEVFLFLYSLELAIFFLTFEEFHFFPLFFVHIFFVLLVFQGANKSICTCTTVYIQIFIYVYIRSI